MQPIFIHPRLDLRQLDYLMPIRVWVVTGQDHPASAALTRTVVGDVTTLLDRIELPLMPLVAGLSTARLATRLSPLSGRRTRSISRRRLRTVARRASSLLSEPLILSAQRADFLFHRGQPLHQAQNHLLDTGRCALPVFGHNLKIGIGLQFRIH